MTLHRKTPTFLFAIAFGTAVFAANPVPLIQQPLGPTSVHPGSSGFTLKVKGDGFVSSTVIDWNGSPLATTFLNSQEVTAAVPSANVAAAGTAAITAVNPPPKGGTSNTIFFSVIPPQVSNAMTASATSATNDNPLPIVAGDFNHDGKLDVITGNQSNPSISVLFGNGDGTFQAPVSYGGFSGQRVWALASGDFNGDGILDLAVVTENDNSSGYVYIMLGKSDGAFQPPGAEMDLFDNPESVVTADFNKDGNLDLAVSSSGSRTTSIFLGNGDGTFGAREDYGTGYFPTQLVVADLNNDGNIDLAVLDNAGWVDTLIGNGEGMFTGSQVLPADSNPQGMAAGDLNGDGRIDLIVGNAESATISVFLGSGLGSFQPHVDYNAGSAPTSLVVGDFNGDGKLDVAATTDSGLSVLLGNGDGTLQPALIYPVANSVALALVSGDFNQDGRLDVAFPNLGGASVITMLQTTLATTPGGLTYNGLQTVGTSSVAQTVVIENIAGGTLALGSITIGGTDPADFTITTDNCPATLTPAQTCQVKVKFTPTLDGTRTASLLIPNNTFGVVQPVILTGYGTIVSLSPARLDFGSGAVGTTREPMASTLKNVGTVTLNITKISIGGPNKTDFSQTNTCGATVAPGTSCSIDVTFTPSATGPRSASVTILDDGNGEGLGDTQSIALSGTGT